MTYVVDLGDKGKFEVEDEIFRVIKAQQTKSTLMLIYQNFSSQT